MPTGEQRAGYQPSDEPLHRIPLPLELAEFLKGYEYACLMQATDKGTIYVVKAPNKEIQSLRGTVPIHLRHELYFHPLAPVIRTVITIFDQPHCPLALETFVNIDDSQQRAEFVQLGTQDTLHLLFYDEAVMHRLTKAIANAPTETIAQIVHEADRLFNAIGPDTYDFDRAKAAVMAAARL